jgi:hypothetical protein
MNALAKQELTVLEWKSPKQGQAVIQVANLARQELLTIRN